MSSSFNAKKSAQAGALLLKLHQGSLDMYIFIKLLYLADRESMVEWGESITGDDAVSMQHGPVLSQIYSLTKGYGLSFREDWSTYISDEDADGHRITLQREPGTGLLSKAEIRILEKIHAKYGNYTFGQMKSLSHGLPEYEVVGATSKPIRSDNLLRILDKSDEEIREIERNRVELAAMTAILSN